MAKNFFDWEDDEELKTSAKVVQMPLTEEQKLSKRADDIFNEGYHVSEKGTLMKEVTLKQKSVMTYDPAELKEDEAGRTYFKNEDGLPVYIDAHGFPYYIMVDDKDKVWEYAPIGHGEIMIYQDPEHNIGATKDGSVYEYDENAKNYVYNPNITLFPSDKFTR